MRVFKAGDGEVLDLAFSPDGTAIAAAVKYQGIYLWNLQLPSPIPVRLDSDLEYRGGLSFSAESRSLSWLGPTSRRVYSRNSRTFADTSFAFTRLTHTVIQSNDGSRVISQHGMPDYCLIGWRESDDGWIRTWTVSTIDLATESLTLSPDGRLLAMLARSALGDRWSSNPRRVEVRDAATAAVLGTGIYPYNIAEPLLFSPDGRQLVGFNDMTLLVWPVPENGSLGSPLLVRNDSRKHFTALAYHPSDRFLYATSNDETVHVFDTTTWDRVRRFTWQLGNLKAVTLSPDGTLAAAGGDHGDVIIWDVDG